jgi:hypothetical protein
MRICLILRIRRLQEMLKTYTKIWIRTRIQQKYLIQTRIQQNLKPDPHSGNPDLKSVEYGISVFRKFLGIPAPLYLCGSGSFHQHANKSRKTLIITVLWLQNI